jgi:RNA polymerase sigma factor (sigma-70 family)
VSEEPLTSHSDDCAQFAVRPVSILDRSTTATRGRVVTVGDGKRTDGQGASRGRRRVSRPDRAVPSGAELRSSTSARLRCRSRAGSAKSSGWSPTPTPCSRGAPSAPLGPEAHYEQTEAISLAFITALQILPPRQRAVLILREVLGYHADEVADLLGSTIESVTSALKRARATLKRELPAGHVEPPPPPDSPAERALVARFVRAYEAGDVEALVGLLTADVSVSMPPIPLEYHGRDVVADFYATIFRRGGRYDLIPTRANRQLAFGLYLRATNVTRSTR